MIEINIDFMEINIQAQTIIHASDLLSHLRGITIPSRITMHNNKFVLLNLLA